MGADNPGWAPPQAGAVRAPPAAVTLMDQARARQHDTGLSERLTARAFGLLGRDAVLTIIGLQDAGKLPAGGAPARQQVIDLARAGNAGIGAAILIGDHEYVCKDRGARRAREDPAAPVDLAGERRAMGLMEPQDSPMVLTTTSHLTAVRMPRAVPGPATAEGS